MGYLLEGEWIADEKQAKATGGQFIRKPSSFRNWITVDGAPGPSGNGGFKAEAGRYHLIVCAACPWAHRTMIFRKLKRLESIVSIALVEPLMLQNGWTFKEADEATGAGTAWQVYVKADTAYSGRATVPILWDREQKTIVSNESSEIIRMFNSAFNRLTGNENDYYPAALRPQIEEINAIVYETVNNGVYRAGFATTQDAYEAAVKALFDTLDSLDARLGNQRYLIGNAITEADWRLFTTLVRFDTVYYSHFKCNLTRISDYPALSAYVRDLYQVPGVAETVDLKAIKTHYYGSHESINPSRIIPLGPNIDFSRPHGRDDLTG